VKERDHSEDLGKDKKNNIRMDFRERGHKVVGWIYLAQKMDQWQALVKTVMNLWVP
jgi:hypothetical protein